VDTSLIAGAVVLAIGLAALVFGLQSTGKPAIEDASDYLRSLEELNETEDEFEALLQTPFLQRVMRPLGSSAFESISRMFPRNYRDQVRQQLLFAGLSTQYRAEEIIVGQVLLSGGLLILTLLMAVFGLAHDNLALALIVGLPTVGALLPRAWLSRKVQERQDTIRMDLPDTLDLMAISVEAGVGFEAAMAVVCEQFNSALAEEFSRTLREMELGLSRREALQNLKRRTEVPELSTFILALTQADALGMPIGRVLKTQATEMRSKRRQWAREKAGKLPVKILFPLVMCIFPAVMVVVLGPAASQIGKAFK
jgi:tight adherence protein C